MVGHTTGIVPVNTGFSSWIMGYRSNLRHFWIKVMIDAKCKYIKKILRKIKEK